MANNTATSAGELNYTKQPAFLAYYNGSVSNVTGDGTYYTVVFSTEVFDQNNNFNGTTTFTAPVTGKYKFASQVAILDNTSAQTDGFLKFVTSNRNYYSARINIYQASRRTSTNQLTLFLATLTDMDQGDTAYIQVSVAGGSKTIDYVGYSSSIIRSFLSGYLFC